MVSGVRARAAARDGTSSLAVGRGGPRLGILAPIPCRFPDSWSVGFNMRSYIP